MFHLKKLFPQSALNLILELLPAVENVFLQIMI